MIPLMGVTSAFVFAVQMVNFPVPGLAGTSGHVLGATLSVVLLGPWAGAAVIAIVLIAQCLIFQDGGLTALGANIFNMSFAGALISYALYSAIRMVITGDRGIILGCALAAWLSIVTSSCMVAVELAVSQVSPLKVVLPAMAAIHGVIGIVEAIITCFIVSFLLKARRDLIYGTEP
jgi:cobalt/nickel transport system permease protein